MNNDTASMKEKNVAPLRFPFKIGDTVYLPNRDDEDQDEHPFD